MQFIDSNEDTAMTESGTLEPFKGQPDGGPFHLRHATHRRVIKGEVCRHSSLPAIKLPRCDHLPCIQDIMFIEQIHQVGNGHPSIFQP
jgi:hypothetical protein